MYYTHLNNDNNNNYNDLEKIVVLEIVYLCSN